MLALYCHMKTRERTKKQERIKYYTKINKIPHTKRTGDSHECRVCLQEAPIHVLEEKNKEELIEALAIFANIHLNPEDQYSKRLCKICFKFIQEAIIFRKTAANSEKILQKAASYLPNSIDSDSGDNFCDNTDFFGPRSPKSPKKVTDTKCDRRTYYEDQNIIDIGDEGECKSKSKKITCKICKKILNKQYYYNEHLAMHDPNAENKYVCDVCGKGFRNNSAFRSHQVRHNKEFTHKCQFCPYQARYKDLLRNHLKNHTGEQKYMCTECPKRFLFKSNLNSHIMLRHREPQFNCDSCKRAFHTKPKLEKHIQIEHLGIRNHVCNICGKAFGLRRAMMKHQLGVHKRAKFSYSRMPSYLQAETMNLPLQNT